MFVAVDQIEELMQRIRILGIITGIRSIKVSLSLLHKIFVFLSQVERPIEVLREMFFKSDGDFKFPIGFFRI